MLWRGKRAAGLLWWVFQDRISLVEAQGDGVIEIIVLHLGWWRHSKCVVIYPWLASSLLPETAGQSQKHPHQVPDLS